MTISYVHENGITEMETGRTESTEGRFSKGRWNIVLTDGTVLKVLRRDHPFNTPGDLHRFTAESADGIRYSGDCNVRSQHIVLRAMIPTRNVNRA
jgi:hypothetical protein